MLLSCLLSNVAFLSLDLADGFETEMSGLDNRIYAAEQIEVPPQLPELVKAFSKEAMRFQPTDLVGFAKE